MVRNRLRLEFSFENGTGTIKNVALCSHGMSYPIAGNVKTHSAKGYSVEHALVVSRELFHVKVVQTFSDWQLQSSSLLCPFFSAALFSLSFLDMKVRLSSRVFHSLTASLWSSRLQPSSASPPPCVQSATWRLLRSLVPAHVFAFFFADLLVFLSSPVDLSSCSPPATFTY